MAGGHLRSDHYLRKSVPCPGCVPAAVYDSDGGAGSGNLSGIPEKTDSISYGASNAFVHTKCKNHSFPSAEMGGFALVEAPAPSPGEHKCSG